METTPTPSPEPLWRGYVNTTLRAESDLLRAAPLMKRFASDPRNWLHGPDEMVLDKVGWIPSAESDDLLVEGPLLPWVRCTMLPRGALTPIRLTYEVRQLHDPVKTLRVLAVELDVLYPSSAPLRSFQVEEGAQGFYRQAQPLVQMFFPLHIHIGASIVAADPVPRVYKEVAYMRTAILMRFVASDSDPLNLENLPADSEIAANQASEPKRKVTLYGPDNKPLRR